MWTDPNIPTRELVYESWHKKFDWLVCRVIYPGTSEHNQLILIKPETLESHYVPNT